MSGSGRPVPSQTRLGHYARSTRIPAFTLLELLVVIARWAFACVLVGGLVPQLSRADEFVGGPTPGITYTSTVVPFLIQELGYTSMRYQQVYNSSLFTNIDASLVYVTTMKFYMYPYGHGGNPW